jgi:hypothetical protein
MAEKKKALLLRIPPDLWESLNRWAKQELRSVNAQIEYVLREAVRKRTGQRPPQPVSFRGNAATRHSEGTQRPKNLGANREDRLDPEADPPLCSG